MGTFNLFRSRGGLKPPAPIAPATFTPVAAHLATSDWPAQPMLHSFAGENLTDADRYAETPLLASMRLTNQACRAISIDQLDDY